MHSLRSIDYDDYLDELDDDASVWGRVVRSRATPKPGRRKPKRDQADILSELAAEDSNREGGFNPSFTGSRHERAWIQTYLSPFYQDHLITDVLRQVKGGKEATVYCCRAHPATGVDLIAAKVYRPREFRTMKNDVQYRQGRAVLDPEGKVVRDKRLYKAIEQGSAFGQQASHVSWLAHEFSTMRLLREAGADVPRPLASSDNALLLEYVGDEQRAAPTLNRVSLPREEAPALFERLMWNVELMLAHDRIHGDLSAYNVLYWEGEATIIDFPQVIDAYGNPLAFQLLSRDVERLCQYFARYGVEADPVRRTRELWRRSMPDETYQIRGARW